MPGLETINLPQGRPTATQDQPRFQSTLGELVDNEGASVRLTRCVRQSDLSAITVAQAVHMGPALDYACRRVPNMGRKSIAELREMLARYADRNGALPMPADSFENVPELESNREEMEQSLLDLVSQVFGGISFSDAITTLGASVRLTNCIENSQMCDTPLGEIVTQWSETARTLVGSKNFGRSSLDELKQIFRGLINQYLVHARVDEKSRVDLSDLLFETGRLSNIQIEQLSQKIELLSEFSFKKLMPLEIEAPEVLVNVLLQELEPRSHDVISRRYRLNKSTSETLEQIATDYCLTRERIRQLEAKALKKMRLKGRQLPLLESLARHASEIWNSFACSGDIIMLAEIPSRSAIAPTILLLMDIQEIEPAELLDIIANRWKLGWYSYAIDTGNLDRVEADLKRALDGKPLPRPLPPLSSDVPYRIIEIALRLGLGLDLHENYVLSTDGSARSQLKSVQIHTLFGTDQEALDTITLAEELARARFHYPSRGVIIHVSAVDHRSIYDYISTRYIVSILESAPHLFIESDDERWFALNFPMSDTSLRALQAPRFRTDAGEGGFTMAGYLRNLLLETGPTKLSNLVDISRGRLPPDRSVASVGPTLITNPETFSRVLPGVYGLREYLPSSTSLFEKAAYLLNNEQARLYALGRRAGEPWGTFPLWSPAAEAALCSWAPNNAEPAVLQSLMAVASIDSWPVDLSTRVAWKEFLANHSFRFQLQFQPRESVGYALPGLDRLLAACLEARAGRRFNWMMGNRILKRPVYSHMSAGLLALMCSLDALKIDQDSDWQLPHASGERLENLISILSIELHDHGTLGWNSLLGARILQQAGDSIGRLNGWVDRRLLATMLASQDTGADAAPVDFIAKTIEADLYGLTWIDEEDAHGPIAPQPDRGLVGYEVPEIMTTRIVSRDEGDWTFDDGLND